MPAAKQIVAIDIDDAKIYEMTADTGGSPTYGTGIDIPNIVELSVTINQKTATLEGDAVVKGVHSRPTNLTGTIHFRSIPVDVLEILIGGTVTQSGTTPNQKTDYTMSQGAKGSYFKLVGRAFDVDGLDAVATGAQLTIYKAKLTGNPTIALNGEFAEVSAEFTGVYTNSDNKLWNLTIEETQSAIS